MGAVEILQLANLLRKLFRNPRQKLNVELALGHPEIGELIDSLREIYFTPDGVVALLEEICSGGPLDQAEVERILPSFNDFEYYAPNIFYRFEVEDLAQYRTLSIRERGLLRQLMKGKVLIRNHVKRLLNQALTDGSRVPINEARFLLESIVSLNAAIEDVEELLLRK